MGYVQRPAGREEIAQYVQALKAERAAWDALKTTARTPHYEAAFTCWTEASARSNALAAKLKDSEAGQLGFERNLL